MQKDWHSIKIGVMGEVLSQKITSCDEFKNNLMNSGNKRLVEAVKSDRYWSCGLNPKEASTTSLSITLVKIDLVYYLFGQH